VCEVCGADGEGKIKLETILKKIRIKKNTSTTYKNNQTGEAEILYIVFAIKIKNIKYYARALFRRVKIITWVYNFCCLIFV